MAEDAMKLFDEFAVRRARGERPDVREYLTRAGTSADELRTLLDRLLSSSPPPAADPALVAAFEARAAGEPPLVALRAHRGISRDEVVAGLLDRLRLGAEKQEKVKRYYHELETGLLDPRGVAGRVFAALEGILDADVESLAACRFEPRPAAAPAAFYRATDDRFESRALRKEPPEPEREWDEVDELFRGA